MKKLPAVSEMEHITSKEFGENMDAILERVSKENIALIIDHEDKSYVLCPARWFEVPELTQLEVMVKNAVRYVSEVDDSDLAETAQTVRSLRRSYLRRALPRFSKSSWARSPMAAAVRGAR